jgi:hypothetical protein
MSPDGSRAYQYDPEYDGPGAPGTISIFDLNSSNGAGGFNQIGSIPVPDYPGSFGVILSVTLDGRNLILTADEKTIILPLP